ncbi:DUF6457 domain-containing protein [Nocardioides sp.]|uniref:DUF6457 domain-containing protein n=1 Tax=Nocardioides sp. TaxID=35761 RepID=UPI002390412C|nr:DUF6457 domain-containing protein [Nocardioides sp.]MDE0776947.1 DUF6457 domain-containing protein [Nocardioides sp.]
MNLHDWIDELCDVLDLETEVDEGLVGDLAELATDNVDNAAGPITAYLLGYAAGAAGAGPAAVEALAAQAQELAERWDKPVLADPDDTDEPESDIELGFDVSDEAEDEEEE